MNNQFSRIYNFLGPACFVRCYVNKEHKCPPCNKYIEDMDVYYGDIKVENGIYLSTSLTIHAPNVVTRGLNPSRYYTLIMYDLNSTIGELVHWVIVNIDNMGGINGDTLAPYLFPKPPPGSGEHTYIFYLFSQYERYLGGPIIDPNNILSRAIPVSELVNRLDLSYDNLKSSVYFVSSFMA